MATNKHFSLGKIEAATIRLDAAKDMLENLESSIRNLYPWDLDENGNAVYEDGSSWRIKTHRPDPSNENERESYEKVLVLEDLKEDFEDWILKNK